MKQSSKHADLEGVASELSPDGTASVAVSPKERVHVRGVLPGERVKIGRVEKRAGALRAADVVVLEASPSRVEAPCPIANRCGGCPLMHASHAFSDRFKTERVERIAGRALDAPLVTPEARLGYRSRARLAFAKNVIGYRAAWGTDIVDVDRCIVLAEPLDVALKALRARIGPHLAGSGELRLGTFEGRATVHVASSEAQPPAVYTALAALVGEGVLAGAALRAGGATVPARFGVEVERTFDADGRPLDAPLGGFSQAHGEHNRALAQHVIASAEADGKRVLELFAGHGNFSLPLAARAKSLTTVELDRDAVACMRTNLGTHGLTARVFELDAALATRAEPAGSIDVVVLDPPREGAHQVARALAALAPSRVVYVSCDAESLGRDLAILAEGGFRLEALHAFDMFPQTPHVEVVARLARTEGAVAAGTRRR